MYLLIEILVIWAGVILGIWSVMAYAFWFLARQPKPKHKPLSRAIRRCMRLAAARGYSPYDSHATQAHCFRLQAGGRG